MLWFLTVWYKLFSGPFLNIINWFLFAQNAGLDSRILPGWRVKPHISGTLESALNRRCSEYKRQKQARKDVYWKLFDRRWDRTLPKDIDVFSLWSLSRFGTFIRRRHWVRVCKSHHSSQPPLWVFISRNPACADRTELSDSLEALFRAVAMMILTIISSQILCISRRGLNCHKVVNRSVLILCLVTMKELFGSTNILKNEWTDGRVAGMSAPFCRCIR